MDVIGWMLSASFFNLGVALLCAFTRLVIGPTLPDRVMSLDLIAVLAAMFIACYSVSVSVDAYLDVSITITLIAFLGTVAFARYVRQIRGQFKDDSWEKTD